MVMPISYRTSACFSHSSRALRRLCIGQTSRNDSSSLIPANVTRTISTVQVLRQQQPSAAASAAKPAVQPSFPTITRVQTASATPRAQATSRNAVPTARNTAAATPSAASVASSPPTPSAAATPSTALVGSAPPTPSAAVESSEPSEPLRDLTAGLSDEPSTLDPSQKSHVDWSQSFHGLSSAPFSSQAAAILTEPLNVDDIEIKPEGLIYLPEIKYRRILNRAFGPGGWGLAPRGETIVTKTAVTREYALIVGGRLVSIARGEQDYFGVDSIPTAAEGCKSNALMRCCKDLGVASELWDPRFIRKYLAEWSKEVWVEHYVTKKRKKITMRKDDEVRYPYKEVRGVGASGAYA